MQWPTPDPVGPGQESVWDYPRPPRLERTSKLLEVEYAGRVIASTTQGWRLLETSHPPTYYLPRAAFIPEVVFRPLSGQTVCEWKGYATYYDIVVGDDVVSVGAWAYPEPTPDFVDIADAVGVMAGLVDQCRVDGEVVREQDGGWYGGWITADVVGPFKGGPGTRFW